MVTLFRWDNQLDIFLQGLDSILFKVWGPDTSVADIFDAVEATIHDADLVPQVLMLTQPYMMLMLIQPYIMLMLMQPDMMLTQHCCVVTSG